MNYNLKKKILLLFLFFLFSGSLTLFLCLFCFCLFFFFLFKMPNLHKRHEPPFYHVLVACRSLLSCFQLTSLGKRLIWVGDRARAGHVGGVSTWQETWDAVCIRMALAWGRQRPAACHAALHGQKKKMAVA